MKKTKKHFQVSLQEKRLIFREGGADVVSQQAEFIDDPKEKYDKVSRDYQAFDNGNLASTQEQLQKYSDLWINQLPAEQKAEATRQWAYCLFMELGIKRADKHGTDLRIGMKLALQAPSNEQEYLVNKSVLESVQAKLKIAIQEGNDRTRNKAEKLSSSIDEILRIMQPPKIEKKEVRMSFSLTEYIGVESKHSGWNIEKIKISLTGNEEMALAQAEQEGYSLVTEKDFDKREGGNLILYKDGSPVSPKTTFNVPGQTCTIIGFPVE